MSLVKSMHRVKISFVGDISFAGKAIYENFDEKKSESLIGNLKQSNLVVGNLEFPFCKDKSLLIRKKFFNDRKNQALLNKFNIKVVSLANNHINDCGLNGILETKKILDYLGIRYLGAGENIIEAYKPLILEIENIRFGFIAACKKGSFSAGKSNFGSAPINEAIIKDKIINLKKISNCDYIILLLHWGVEYSLYPHPDDRNLARRCIEYGANIIIGSHPHVIQGYEKYNDGLIFYSLGNFITDLNLDIKPSRKIFSFAKFSIILEIMFTHYSYEFKIIPVKINKFGFPEILDNEREIELFISKINEINSKLDEESIFYKNVFKNIWFRELKAWAINFVKHPINSVILFVKVLNKKKVLMLYKFIKLNLYHIILKLKNIFFKFC